MSKTSLISRTLSRSVCVAPFAVSAAGEGRFHLADCVGVEQFRLRFALVEFEPCGLVAPRKPRVFGGLEKLVHAPRGVSEIRPEKFAAQFVGVGVCVFEQLRENVHFVRVVRPQRAAFADVERRAAPPPRI